MPWLVANSMCLAGKSFDEWKDHAPNVCKGVDILRHPDPEPDRKCTKLKSLNILAFAGLKNLERVIP